MKPDIFVDIEALKAHADQVGGVAGVVQLGVDGVRHMSGHPEIYGILCSPMFLPIAEDFGQYTDSCLASARDAVQRLEQKLRETATGYEETDRYIARLIAGEEGS